MKIMQCCIDPIPFDAQRNIAYFGPTHTPQIIRMKGHA
jgi:hypothetical protein